MAQVIVIGGGLSGVSAANTVLEKGGRVLLLDKMPFCGGNSTKATSGINAALSRTQIQQKIPDSVEIFERDTALSATGGSEAKSTDLIKVMVGESANAVEWLQTSFNLDLSLLSQLGGHAFKRTHRGKEKFPGMTITYALIEGVERAAKQTPERCRIITKARATKLIVDQGKVIGVTYEKDGKSFDEYGCVIICTGGYCHDYESDSLLKKYRPDLLKFPTTNGPYCTGDGIKMSQAIGADIADIEWVQVHPTGLVHPDEPDAKVKFLAAEALRGVGGIMLDADGNRFCDELGRRDYVSGLMFKNKAPFRLLLNTKSAAEIEWHCKHYVGRGLMKVLNASQIAQEMGIPLSKLKQTFDQYNACAQQNKCPHGRKFFANMPWDINDTFQVSIITPVVHYCMGGLRMNADSQVVSTNGQPITGLWAAGEVMGGVHGKNRLGGNSLLDCVVFGRVAGRSACSYLMRNLVSCAQQNPSIFRSGPAQRLETLSKQVTASAAVSSGSGKRTFSAAEVAKHNTKNDCWTIIDRKVYDVTKFLDDHPGGAKAILLYAGKDATEQFDMLHDRNVIAKYAPDTYIGDLE